MERIDHDNRTKPPPSAGFSAAVMLRSLLLPDWRASYASGAHSHGADGAPSGSRPNRKPARSATRPNIPAGHPRMMVGPGWKERPFQRQVVMARPDGQQSASADAYQSSVVTTRSAPMLLTRT
jgi:hypothetical protein